MELIKDKLTGLIGIAQARRHDPDDDRLQEERSRSGSSSDSESEYISTRLINNAGAKNSEIHLETLA